MLCFCCEGRGEEEGRRYGWFGRFIGEKWCSEFGVCIIGIGVFFFLLDGYVGCVWDVFIWCDFVGVW